MIQFILYPIGYNKPIQEKMSGEIALVELSPNLEVRRFKTTPGRDDTANFVIKDDKVLSWRVGEKGIGFYEYPQPYQIMQK